MILQDMEINKHEWAIPKKKSNRCWMDEDKLENSENS